MFKWACTGSSPKAAWTAFAGRLRGAVWARLPDPQALGALYAALERRVEVGAAAVPLQAGGDDASTEDDTLEQVCPALPSPTPCSDTVLGTSLPNPHIEHGT